MLVLIDGTAPIGLAVATCERELDRTDRWVVRPAADPVPHDVWERLFRQANPVWKVTAGGPLASQLLPIGPLEFAPDGKPGTARTRVLAGYTKLLDLLEKNFADTVTVADPDTRTLLDSIAAAKDPAQAAPPGPAVLPAALVQHVEPDLAFVRRLLARWTVAHPDRPLALAWGGRRWEVQLTKPRDNPPRDRQVGAEFTAVGLAAAPGRGVGLILETLREFDSGAWAKERDAALPHFVQHRNTSYMVVARTDWFVPARGGNERVEWTTRLTATVAPWSLAAGDAGPRWGVFAGRAGALRDHLIGVTVAGAEDGRALIHCHLLTPTTGADLKTGLHLVPAENSPVLIAAACGLFGPPPVHCGAVRDQLPTHAGSHLHLADLFALFNDTGIDIRELGQNAGVLVKGGKVAVAK